MHETLAEIETLLVWCFYLWLFVGFLGSIIVSSRLGSFPPKDRFVLESLWGVFFLMGAIHPEIIIVWDGWDFTHRAFRRVRTLRNKVKCAKRVEKNNGR